MGERAVHGATILLFRLCLHTMMAHVSKNLERIVGNTDISTGPVRETCGWS
jgi:hypothetical protein